MTQISRWHNKQWQEIYAYKEIPHSLLFSGVAGLGKNEFALELGRKVLCRDSIKSDNLTCSKDSPCSSCRLLTSETNPDILILDPPPAKQIVVEDISSLRDFLLTSSHLGGAKVVIIPNIERMNLSAANASLKLLEEPPPNKYLLFTTSSKSLLLPTILSRCVKIQFVSPPPSEINEWLMEEHKDLWDKVQDKDLLLSINHYAPLAIAKMLVSGKAELLSHLNSSLSGNEELNLNHYKDLDMMEILDLLIWRTEKWIKRTSTGEERKVVPLFYARSWLLERREMLLRKINLSRELLLRESWGLVKDNLVIDEKK